VNDSLKQKAAKQKAAVSLIVADYPVASHYHDSRVRDLPQAQFWRLTSDQFQTDALLAAGV
jgi:hypothetical protein